MSTFSNRIKWLGQPDNQTSTPDQVAYTPTADYKDYGAVKEIPLSRVQVSGGILGYDEPLLTADGAVVTSTGPGQWGQLYRAGRY
jgi:hypothetical protein